MRGPANVGQTKRQPRASGGALVAISGSDNSDLGSLAMKQQFPPDFVENLCTAVGRIVVHWAMLEAAFSQWIAILYQGAGGKHLEDKIPIAYKRKRKFIRRCFNRFDALGPYREEAISIIEASVSISKVRDFVVHGALSTHDEDAGAITFSKLDVPRNGDIHRIATKTFHFEELVDRGEECLDLSCQALNLTKRLLQSGIVKNSADKAP